MEIGNISATIEKMFSSWGTVNQLPVYDKLKTSISSMKRYLLIAGAPSTLTLMPVASTASPPPHDTA